MKRECSVDVIVMTTLLLLRDMAVNLIVVCARGSQATFNCVSLYFIDVGGQKINKLSAKSL